MKWEVDRTSNRPWPENSTWIHLMAQIPLHCIHSYSLTLPCVLPIPTCISILTLWAAIVLISNLQSKSLGLHSNQKIYFDFNSGSYTAILVKGHSQFEPTRIYPQIYEEIILLIRQNNHFMKTIGNAILTRKRNSVWRKQQVSLSGTWLPQKYYICIISTSKREYCNLSLPAHNISAQTKPLCLVRI